MISVLERGNLNTDTNRRKMVWRCGENVAICKLRRGTSEETNCADTSIWLLASRTMRKLINVVRIIQTVVFCYGSPRKQRRVNTAVPYGRTKLANRRLRLYNSFICFRSSAFSIILKVSAATYYQKVFEYLNNPKYSEGLALNRNTVQASCCSWSYRPGQYFSVPWGWHHPQTLRPSFRFELSQGVLTATGKPFVRIVDAEM